MLIGVRAKTGASLDAVQFIFVHTENGCYYESPWFGVMVEINNLYFKRLRDNGLIRFIFLQLIGLIQSNWEQTKEYGRKPLDFGNNI